MTRTTQQTARAELAKIHIAKKELGLDDGAYRTLLWTVARVRSSKDLDQHGRRAVLDHLKSRGWKPRKASRAGRVPHTLNRKEQLAKIEAQLTSLDAPWEYADAIAKKVAKVDACAWLKTPEQFGAVIAALETEQKKRDALWWTDKMLGALGLTHGFIDELVSKSRRGRWQRHMPSLKNIVRFLEAKCGEQGIDLFALHAQRDYHPEPPHVE